MLPLKRIRIRPWECSWLIFSVVSLVLVPWAMAWLTLLTAERFVHCGWIYGWTSRERHGCRADSRYVAFNAQHSAIGRVTALAATGDGSRLYAGSFAGVWRSDDGGQNWRQMTWGSPSGTMQMADIPGALFAPNIYDVVISPADADSAGVCAKQPICRWTRRDLSERQMGGCVDDGSCVCPTKPSTAAYSSKPGEC